MLSDASRRAIYPELHKRLDDAHNAVRVAACGALRAFALTAGPSYCDTNSRYLVAGVVIHMDDSDPAVQVCTARRAPACTMGAILLGLITWSCASCVADVAAMCIPNMPVIAVSPRGLLPRVPSTVPYYVRPYVRPTMHLRTLHWMLCRAGGGVRRAAGDGRRQARCHRFRGAQGARPLPV
jgi:hypothetical protein